MRTVFTGCLFALALLVAACGGGGKSSVIPGSVNSGSGGQPSSAKTTNATIVLNIPAPNKQVSRRPLYLSSGTQSLGVLVVPATSSETPTPLNLTIFPVATPSPCAVASAGGYTCTLNVTAPVGTDNFFVGAFATASPNANAVPLSQYAALGVVVSAGGAPLTFTLDGVVYKVQISVPSPDPGNTPFTQVLPAGVAAGPFPLGITVYDSSNNPILTNVTDTFATPIAIGSPSPGGDGVSLSLNGATCSTITNGAVSIGCAADLNKVQFSYSGETTPDPNDHVIDTFTIATTTGQANPTPSPAHVVLSSNMLSWQLGTGLGELDNGYLTLTSSGAFVYAATAGEGSNYIGTFVPSTQTVGAAAPLNGVDELEGTSAIAVDNTSGALWVSDAGAIDCFSSVTNAIGGAAPSPAAIQPYNTNDEPVDVTAIAVDSAQNVWYSATVTGDYDDDGDTYVGYFPATSGCASSIPVPTAQFFINDDYQDNEPYLTVQNGGGIAFQTSSDEDESNAVYLMTPTAIVSPPPVNATATAQLSGGYGTGVAIDGAGSLYGGFSNGNVSDVETLASGGSTFAQMLLVPPSSGGDYASSFPEYLAAFSPTSTAADRLLYSDYSYGAFGLIESVPASPMPLLAPVANLENIFQSTHSTKGGEYALYEDLNNNLDLARVIPTTTWSVPDTQFESVCGEIEGLLGIVERGDRGPFTVTYSPSATSNILLPGTDHDYLTEFTSPSSISVQVQDAGGRTEIYPISTVTIPGGCGIAHRPLHAHPRPKPNFSRAAKTKLGIRTP